MLELTAGYPRQFREALSLARGFTPPKPPADVHEVVILGTGGGSAAGAYLVAGYLYDRCRVPIQVVQGYTCPAFVDEHTLVVAVSHSGRTEEVLAALPAAFERGATVMAMGAGGPLADLARQAGAPYLTIPGGMMPRVAIGSIMVPLLVVLHRWGLAPDPRPDLDEAIAVMAGVGARCGPEVPVASNPAKAAARDLAGKVAFIYAAAPHMDAVARRMKNQMGENAKYMAAWNAIPHLHHDEAVGWDMEPDLLRRLGFVLLRDRAGESEKMTRRWQATAEILRERAGAVVELEAVGEGLLARMLSLVTLTDYITIYLALHKGVDPTPVSIIDLFKARVGQ